MWTRFAVAAFVLVVGHDLVQGQDGRFELGQRLKALETSWEAQPPDAAGRKRSAVPLKRAVGLFFGGRFGDAGRALDEARHLLASETGGSPARQWAASLALTPKTRLIDGEADSLPLELSAFYPMKLDAPAGAKLRVTFLTPGGKPVSKPAEITIGSLPQSLNSNLDGIGAGDYWLHAEVLAGATVVGSSRQMISRVANLSSRLEQLAKKVDPLSNVRTTAGETLRSHRELLQSLHDRKPQETTYPAAELLAEAERLADDLANNKSVDWLQNRRGSWRLTLSDGQRRMPCRVFAPVATQARTPMPLVVALHGAGGSENLFFEGYGAGKVVTLCQERGWLLVAPRVGFALSLGALLDELSRLYPVDAKRVMVVGHSMGAAQALTAVNQIPTRLAAVAALGGGGAVRKPDAFRTMPLFVGCGLEDFALSGARSLARSARGAPGARVELKEYEHVEHLMIVAVALPDVFKFFDQVAMLTK